MEWRSAQKSPADDNRDEPVRTKITVNGQELETVKQFKYLGAIISQEGSKPEVLARTAQTSAALAKLKPIWKDKNIALTSKIRLLHALIISIFLYACETSTFDARTAEEDPSSRDKMLQKTTRYFVH